jgi:predicted nuclease of predicted toxin-antitoxin system
LKILLDHNLDRRLKRYLKAHDVSTTQEQGWADVLNGELLALLEANGFDLMLTADANIRSQQNLSNRGISIIVLRAHNNRLATHLEMLVDIETAISKAGKGDLVEIFHKDF